MDDDFDYLAQVMANALVSCMMTESWTVTKSRFIGLIGNERRIDATYAELAAASGQDLAMALITHAQVWRTRLRDALDDNPNLAVGLRTLLADVTATPLATSLPGGQHAQADRGSQAVTVGSNAGEIYVGVGRVDKRRMRIFLSPVAL